MATTKPRITVTLDQGDYDLLKQWSVYSGESASAILADIWKTAVPPFSRVMQLVHQAKQVEHSAKEGLLQAAEDAEARFQPVLQQTMVNLSLFEEEIKAVLSAGGACEERACPPPAKPPSSNTGVRSNSGRGVKPARRGKT